MLRYAKKSDYDITETTNTKIWQQRYLIETLPGLVGTRRDSSGLVGTRRDSSRVLEVGANKNTIILDALAGTERWIADPYDARGVGVLSEPPDLGPDYTISRCVIGLSSNALPSEHFDLIFSSSVLEHIGQREANFDLQYTPDPPEAQETLRRAFCEECFRLLRPGGVTVHTIDHGVRNISFDANFREAGFEALDPAQTVTHQQMLDDPEALRQTVAWHGAPEPLHPGIARLNTVLAIGYRRPADSPKRWASLPEFAAAPAQASVEVRASTPWTKLKQRARSSLKK